MEFIKAEEIVSLTNTGVVSRQLLNPDNSDSERVTITEVHLESNACGIYKNQVQQNKKNFIV
ncbi:MAG: hypothetical protein II220_09320 [Spirochaetales bacterium]|nr:hypothetical protein [Spirochaetales bacterium]